MTDEEIIRLQGRLDVATQEAATCKSNNLNLEKQVAYLNVELERHKIFVSEVKKLTFDHDTAVVLSQPKLVRLQNEARYKLMQEIK